MVFEPNTPYARVYVFLLFSEAPANSEASTLRTMTADETDGKVLTKMLTETVCDF